jgi:hypothetical protein
MPPWSWKPRRGTDNPRSVLTEDLVRYIRDQVTSKGRTRKDVAAELKINPATVAAVVNGRTWSHVK